MNHYAVPDERLNQFNFSLLERPTQLDEIEAKPTIGSLQVSPKSKCTQRKGGEKNDTYEYISFAGM